jgi:S-adenosylmethionine hydrolase
MNGIVTLTTDFGDASGYAAALKGVILGIAPDVRLVDISHRVAPQNVFEAAFLLSTVYRCFPHHTVHLVVVDPGVGTDRKIVALKTPEGTFVGPDNGVFSYVARDYTTGSGEITGDAMAVSVTNGLHFRHPMSATFQGRDIIAPVTAMLSNGFELTAFGEPLERLIMLDLPRPEKQRDGTLIGHVILIDGFGNLITNVRAEALVGFTNPSIVVAGRTIKGLSMTYAEGSGLMALIGSSGYLEIAVPSGSAAAVTGLCVSDTIKISAS